MRGKKTSAFTLVELLMVIAILCLLAAIVFPVFAQVREKSRQSVCASNLRQIGLATAMYRADYDGNYPDAVENAVRYNPENAGSPQYSAWQTMKTLPELLQSYSSSRMIFDCPSDVRPFPAYHSDGTRFTAESRFAAYGMSYEFNPQPGMSGAPEGANSSPSTMLYVYDIGFDYHSYISADFEDRQGNVLFGDGHVHFQSAAPTSGH